MRNLSCGFLLIFFLTINAGCDDARKNAAVEPAKQIVPPTEVAKPIVPLPAPQPKLVVEKPPEPTPEEIAREKIKAGLDAWVFGDTLKQFDAKHPDMMFTDFSWGFNETLLRYEIGQSRIQYMGTKDGKPYPIFEFIVTITQTTKGGQQRVKNKSYTVQPPSSSEPRWIVLGLNN